MVVGSLSGVVVGVGSDLGSESGSGGSVSAVGSVSEAEMASDGTTMVRCSFVVGGMSMSRSGGFGR